MSLNVSSRDVASTNKLKSPSFQRTQLVLALWGVLLLVAGWLHNNFGSSWGKPLTLTMWLGVAMLGLVAMYLIQRLVLNSGMLLVWAGVLVLGLIITWAALFPFSIYKQTSYSGCYIAALWHGLFALGYLLVGYYMDRRFWFLALWEALLTALLMLIALDVLDADFVADNSGLAFGLSSAIGLFVAALPIWKPRNHL